MPLSIAPYGALFTNALQSRSTTPSIDTLEGTSISSVLASISTNAIVSGIMLAIFVIARVRFRRIYEPRAFIHNLEDEKRMNSLPRTPWGWIVPLFKIFRNPELIVQRSGLDAYFFMRFLRMIIIIFCAALLIIWPILLPINAVGGVNDNPGSGQVKVTGLDRLAFGNVNRQHTSRYWAHLILAYLFVIWICVYSLYEMMHFIEYRRKWLTSSRHQAKASATTILVTSIPKKSLTDGQIRLLYSQLPGGVKNVWLNRDYSNLLVDVNNRDSIARKLELAELHLLQMAQRARRKGISSVGSGDQATSCPGNSLVDRYVPRAQRPQHRLPVVSWFFGLPVWTFIGKKVDTIDWCKSELARLNPEISRKQKEPEMYKPMNSAFVQFNRQIAAHMAVQSVAHHRVKAFSPRYLEVSPQDVVWTNMQLHWWERYIWIVLVWAAVIAFTIFYAIPVAFIGTLSHVTDLVSLFPWLGFLNTNTKSARIWSGLVTGVLPSLLLTILISLIPLLMKLAARMQGHPSRPTISSAAQDMFFFFLFVQVFLIVTISSGITALIDSALQNPTQIPQLLATNLPKAANLYERSYYLASLMCSFFSYMIIQGLTVASIGLAQVWFLFLHYFFKSLTATPRSKWKRDNEFRNLTWGTMYPAFSNLAAIGIVYSIIAPLIMIFVIVAFILFAIVHLYNFMYVYNFVTDTGGAAFPKAIQHIFVGVYFLELCLTGLFFLVRNADGSGVPCKVQGILMIVLIILTIAFQLLFHHNFHPLVQFLPLDHSTISSTISDSSHDTEGLLESKMIKTSCDDTIDLTKRSSHTGNSDEQDDMNSESDRTKDSEARYNSLLVEAFKHEALRRREPIIWLPEDDLGIAADEIGRMPKEVKASMLGARLSDHGRAHYEPTCSPPDYVRSDDALL